MVKGCGGHEDILCVERCRERGLTAVAECPRHANKQRQLRTYWIPRLCPWTTLHRGTSKHQPCCCVRPRPQSVVPPSWAVHTYSLHIHATKSTPRCEFLESAERPFRYPVFSQKQAQASHSPGANRTLLQDTTRSAVGSPCRRWLAAAQSSFGHWLCRRCTSVARTACRLFCMTRTDLLFLERVDDATYVPQLAFWKRGTPLLGSKCAELISSLLLTYRPHGSTYEHIRHYNHRAPPYFLSRNSSTNETNVCIVQ